MQVHVLPINLVSAPKLTLSAYKLVCVDELCGRHIYNNIHAIN